MSVSKKVAYLGIGVALYVVLGCMMNIPLLGVIENMSYYKCPDCGKELHIFGDSHLEDILKDYQIDLWSKLPINPELSSLQDKGLIEEADIPELENFVTKIIESL